MISQFSHPFRKITPEYVETSELDSPLLSDRGLESCARSSPQGAICLVSISLTATALIPQKAQDNDFVVPTALSSRILDDFDQIRFYGMMDAEITLHQMRN
ncbi:hypothetical protein Cadr_000022339 [Camelus dromedarius]|uniref:Uncharacterized protein n=1 Tax=Camelus dromedarius TaxID=9838 RepID=A0A5N4CRT9_CAMDR|nr:hypothetical protein Cadr_000022339 [Camelus dromedarius]KAB1261559.1 hypothetical protein Cadr_000022339 [Camelus dromedarius]KAB1261560.1 hypothetical protein Cadr_000022339 [Camelus dromedarius]